jgi:hypothetical protein
MSKKSRGSSEKALDKVANRNTPLPLIVAEQWDFPLQIHHRDGEIWYSIQDWIRGLIDTDEARKIWNDLQRRETVEMSDSIRQLPYLASDGKTYQVDFTNDIGLYLVAQSLRATKARPQLSEIKDYLAKAGAFTDLVRREPETVVTSGAIEPDDAIDAAIEEYRRRGKSDAWINARLNGKIKRKMFTSALNAAISDMQDIYYALATNEVYQGLWRRTAEMLRSEMGISQRKSLRDQQPTLALTYQGIAAEVIGKQARATGEYLGIDLATGKALLGD